jgi:low affinity Fe/Cu permease
MAPDLSGRGRERRERFIRRTQELPATSQLVYRIDHLSSLPGASILVAVAMVGAVIVGACVGFSSQWATGFAVGTSVVTLIMVFVIQHTQGREQAATQRKLDELLRALPGAESGLMMLEEAPEEVLRDVENLQRRTRGAMRARTDGTGDTSAHQDDKPVRYGPSPS